MSNAVATKKDAPIHRGEIALLAREMASCYEGMVKFYEKEYKLTRSQARKKADYYSDEYWKIIEARPPHEIDFHQLQSYHDRSPEEALAKWAEIKSAAADELASGMRGAQLTKWETPYKQAQFLALRQSFIDEWQPRGGIEQSLIDQLAHCYTGWMFWLQDFEQLRQREVDQREIESEDSFAKWNKTYRPPRVNEAAYVERALKMADRFQRMFMRSLRALRDLRRYTPRIMIHNQGQLNIGQQQVNRVETSK